MSTFSVLCDIKQLEKKKFQHQDYLYIFLFSHLEFYAAFKERKKNSYLIFQLQT